jgi:hypothetical protein
VCWWRATQEGSHFLFYGPPQSQPRAQPTQLSQFLVVRGLLDAEEFLDPRPQ